jgi:Secretion system C-terminal sorting domain
MKPILFSIIGLLLFYVSPQRVSAQSFTVQADTVIINNPAGSVNLPDTIKVTSAIGQVTLRWQVIETNFPADWIAGSGICDDSLCYPSGFLWPSMTLKKSAPYTSTIHDFHMQLGLDGAYTVGTFYMKVRLYNQATPTDTAVETFIVTKDHGAGVPVVKSAGEIVLYPNPATDEVNVVFDAAADVKNIAIYNVIGKVMAVYKVNCNSANMSLENMPGGIYYVRLVNGEGNIVGTKKFTKNP